ncbi:hypothetical protein HFN89_05235 [Rhizobium laguerreae]|nr:hypothetical protein [Rhizobium laguerreae]
MKFEISKNWFTKRAALEADREVGAGLAAFPEGAQPPSARDNPRGDTEKSTPVDATDPDTAANAAHPARRHPSDQPTDAVLDRPAILD